MTEASARIVAAVSAEAPQRNPTVCAVLSCVARPLLITVVCKCVIWKALYPYILHVRLGLWVSLGKRKTSPHIPRHYPHIPIFQLSVIVHGLLVSTTAEVQTFPLLPVLCAPSILDRKTDNFGDKSLQPVDCSTSDNHTTIDDCVFGVAALPRGTCCRLTTPLRRHCASSWNMLPTDDTTSTSTSLPFSGWRLRRYCLNFHWNTSNKALWYTTRKSRER